MEAILHRECARCERSGSVFCLVVIDPGVTSSATVRLGELLMREVRQTDEIGFLDSRRLCAFLPYTTAAGAEQFMSRLMRRAAAMGWTPASKLYVYPSRNPHHDELLEEIRNSNNDHPSGGAAAAGLAGVEELLAKPSPWWKRLIDIIFSLSALLLLSPLMIAIALAIKLTSRGPVLFTQMRSGIGGKPFRIYKFRTMIPDADRIKNQLLHHNEQDGPAFKMTCDPRITRIGRILRKTSLDELPQFFNVVLGDMSLVGPRPLPINESRACDTWHRRRLDVVPGITCTWQISGRGTVSFADWVRMDRKYIQRRSLLNDVKLMMLTVPAVLARRGAK
jgi:lipopolysaccharide/colanic/teichoic acid biosynthesis glycosyltransferase